MIGQNASVLQRSNSSDQLTGSDPTSASRALLASGDLQHQLAVQQNTLLTSSVALANADPISRLSAPTFNGSDDKTVMGSVALQEICFQKHLGKSALTLVSVTFHCFRKHSLR